MTSPFQVRGVIEGFYGNPWTHDQRLAMVDWMAAHDLTTFVHGPKDDPLVRRRWREPYSGGAEARLRELAGRCQARGVQLVVAVHPAMTISYADPAEVATLVAKLRQLLDLGAAGVAVLLDDTPGTLQHDADRAAFTDLAEAHVHLLRAAREGLGPDAWLLACPWAYWGDATASPYLATLAAGIDPAIDLFWTGPRICSHTIGVADAQRFEAVTGRRPLYWDNYPVNDVAMGFELHVGPYLGRDPGLGEASRGVIANPMELAQASRIPLATLAEFLANPAAYDPEAAWRRAILETAADADDAEAFAIIAENLRSSCLDDDDAPTVSAALAGLVFAVERVADAVTGAVVPARDVIDAVAALDAACSEVESVAAVIDAAAHHLLHGPVANPALVAECRPWLEAAAVGAVAMTAAAEVASLAADPEALERAARAVLLPHLAELRRRRVRIFGDALEMTLADLANTHVRPGELTLATEGGGLA